MANEKAAYGMLGAYVALVLGAGIWGAVLNFRAMRTGSKVKEHFLAGNGLRSIPWFFTMAATLFSGYSVSGIVNEAYNFGWRATQWIPGGVGVYVGYLVLAPRLHALGKQRGYMTISQFIYDRYLPPSGPKWVAHALRLGSFFCLQLPVFTYLITQFQSVGREINTFTRGGVSPITAILLAAAVLLIGDVLGGMRAVAYTDVVQGVVLMVGSIIFLIVQHTELGGLEEAFKVYSNPRNLSRPNVAAMQLVPTETNIVAYFDFVFKTTIAATMFPHLLARLFVARDSTVMRRGLAGMNFTFFLVQLASMITGWVAIGTLGQLPRGRSAFGSILVQLASKGTSQALGAAVLLAAAICAMMSTADSALLAFSSMWVKDLFKPYLYRNASEGVQLMFGRVMSVVGLAIGVFLGVYTVKRGKPDLSALFALQNVTPIHVAPCVWLGLHWRGLRGEAAAAGMMSGLAVTLGLVFSPLNVRRAVGSDMMKSGISTSMVGLCVNVGVTVLLGLLLQYWPKKRPSTPAGDPQHVDIGTARDPLVNPAIWLSLVLLLLFSAPIVFTPRSPVAWVGKMALWAFLALMFAAAAGLISALAYLFLWKDYEPVGGSSEIPSTSIKAVDIDMVPPRSTPEVK